MAKKDVILRFAQAENEYTEMLSLLNEMQEDLKNNKIDQEYYTSKYEILEEEIESIKQQYFFWAEAIFELNKPNRKEKHMNVTELGWYNTIQTCTKECLKDSSQDALKFLKTMLKEGKKNEE